LDLKIHLSHLSLKRFRSFPELELDLGTGISLFHGANGNGKSNLLEALYLLAVAKSPRVVAEHELVGFGPAYEDADVEQVDGQVHAVVSATVDRSGEPVVVRIDLLGPAEPANSAQRSAPEDSGRESPYVDWTGVSFQKVLRVNGAPRRAWELVGEVNAVLFSAADLNLIYGSPSVRRRYLDILISQHDRAYLRALQFYQRGITQRNHLLRAIRDGRSNPVELGPWNKRVAHDGGYIVAARIRAIKGLRDQSAAVYADLSIAAQTLDIDYRSSFMIPDTTGIEEEVADVIATALAAALMQSKGRDAAQGHTSVGPHRDDLRILIDGADAARYASRGQARSAVLALKLAEAEYLSERRGETPVILLDDVLSEMDPVRRELVLDRVAGYDQCLITTAELDVVDPARRAKMKVYEVRAGTVVPPEPST
jgi:DNA replication and repair protein RecF